MRRLRICWVGFSEVVCGKRDCLLVIMVLENGVIFVWMVCFIVVAVEFLLS